MKTDSLHFLMIQSFSAKLVKLAVIFQKEVSYLLNRRFPLSFNKSLQRVNRMTAVSSGFLVFIVLHCGFIPAAFAQCPTPPTRTNPTILLNNGLYVGQSTSFYMYSYQYFVIENVTTGRTIRISTCGCGYDSQITLRDWSTDTYLAYNDDNGPVCSGTASSLDYSGNSSYPHVKVILNQYSCTSNSIYTYVTVTYLSENTTPADPSSISVSNNPICNGSGTQLTANGAVGTVYWYTGGCGSSFYTTGNPITVYPSSSTTYYARNYNNGSFSNGCASATVTVNSAPGAPNNLSASSTGTSTANISWSGNGGSPSPTYYWEVYTSGGSYVTGSNTSSTSASVSGLSANSAYYFRVYASNSCGSSSWSSNSSNFTSYPADPTSISGTTTLCNGSSTTLTANGAQGTVYWYTGSCGGTPTSPATGNTLTVSPSSTTTYYARNYNGNWSSGCASVTVTVNTAPSISSHPSTSTQNLCLNGSATALSVTAGGTGLSYQWYSNSSQSNTGGSSIDGATSSSYTPLTSTAGTKYYYCVVSGTCAPAATSNASGAIVVSPASVGGTATATNATLCTGNSTTISVTGYTGTIQWQQSANGSSGWANVSGGSGATSETYTTPNLTSTTYYRAVLTSGVCSSSNSTTAQVTINPASVAGSISGATTVCTGTNSTVLTLSGYTGTIQWQSSADNNTFDDISGATSATYTATNLTSTTYYRVVVTSGVCSAANSSAATINVSPAASGGTAEAEDDEICTGNTTTITVSSYSGSIQWQQSANGSTGWASVSGGSGATSATYTTPVLTSTTYYRAVITSGVCSENSTTAQVTVNALPTVAAITGTTSLCSGLTTQLSCTTPSGTWTSSVPAVATINSSGLVSGISEGSTTITYTVTNGYGCSNASTTQVSVTQTLDPPTSVTATPAIIQTGQSSSLSGTVPGNNSILWYTAASGGTSFGTTASGGSITVSPSVTTTYYAEASPCSENSLSNILSNLNSNYGSIINQIPNRYDFTEGSSGNYINDGGNDMYDGGNYLSTNNSNNFNYSDNSVVNSAVFGSGGKYFTRKVQGLFVLAADMVNVSWFKVNGNYGSDCSGSVSSSTFTVTVGCKTFNCFLSRVYNAGDPSINELFIIPANASALHTGIGNTCDSYHNLNSISSSSRMYYLLYAGSNGSFINDTYAQNIATAFLTQTQAVLSGSGCTSLTRTPVTVTINNLPAVTTATVTDISPTTATGGGNVTSDGGAEVTVRGTCWSTSANPTTSGSKTEDGSGTGTFASSITGLTPGTLYYVRAYATNSVGTTYGNQVSFTSYSAGTIGSNQEICSGSVPAMLTSLSAPAGMPSPSYQWQNSTDNSTFSNISGATSAAYQPGNLSQTTYYRRNAIQGGVTLSSNVVTISMSEGIFPATNVTATPSVILSGQSSNLNATTTSGNEIRWYTAPEGGSLLGTSASGANFAVSPTVTTTYYAQAAPITCTDNTLANILSGLNTNYGNIINQIPNRYDFSEGSSGNYINDGGNDMYDGGNYLSTNNNSSFSYSDNSVVNSSIFGSGGRYFTRKVQGLFVLAADMANVSWFKINGNYGSDCGGSTNSSTFTITVGCKTFNCFLSRVYNAGDPSINELIIVPANPSAYQTGIANTCDSYHTLNGISSSTRLYYLLYAGSSGYYINDTYAQSIATAFLTQSGAVITGSGDCPATSLTSVTVTLAGVPTVTTAAVTNVQATTAESGGNVTSDGGSAVTSRGVCWGTSQNPTTSGSHTSNGTGAGSFTSSITGLTTGTTYYVRAYAINSMGTGYGEELTFSPFTLGSFPDITKTYGDPAFTLVAPSSASPGAFTFTSSNTSVATISGSTVTITGAGSSTLTATQAASGGYGSTSTTCLLTVNKANQVVTLTVPTSQPLNFFTGGNTLTINASSSSGLTVTVTINTGSSTASGTLTPTASPGEYILSDVSSAGVIVFDAQQAGNANYNPGSTSQNFIVEYGNQQIDFDALPDKTYGDPDFTISVTGGGSGNPVTFTSSNTSIATCTGTNGATIHIVGAGSCLITANQPGNSSWNAAPAVSQLLTVGKDTPVITFADINKTYGDLPFTLIPESNSSGAFSFESSNSAVGSLSGNTCTVEGAGSSTLTVYQAADDNYLAGSASASLIVGKASQTVSIDAIADIYLANFEVNPITVTASASSGLPVALSLASGSVATLEGNTLSSTSETGSVTVYVNQAGNDNYFAATQVSESFNVSTSDQTITFDALGTKYLNDPPFDLNATASSGLPVSYTSSNTAVATIEGKTVTLVGTGNTTITASQAGNASWNPATPVQQVLTVTLADQTITFDALPVKHVGDDPFELTATASSGLTVSYVSSNTAVATVSGTTVTILTAGSTVITASQEGNTYYNAATPVDQTLTVGDELFLYWEGDESTDWNEPGNWSTGSVPLSTDNVVIQASAANQPEISSGVSSPASCNKLTVEEGASVTIPADKALTVNGLITNNAGTYGILIRSDATGTGSLIHSTASVNGTIQRYITGNETLTAMTYHLVSIPLTPSTTSLSGIFMDSYLYRFNEPSNDWEGLGNSTTTALDETKGYMIYLPETSTTYSFEGPMNAGSFSSTITNSLYGYNLIPNPYPSAIDWEAASGWTKTGIHDAIYIWPSGGSNYAAYVDGEATNGGSQYIPAGQAFFIRAESGSPAISMNNGIRVHNTHDFFKQSGKADVLRIKAIAGGLTDEAVVRFSGLASTQAEGERDAWKMPGLENAPQLYTLSSDDEQLSINTLPYSQEAYTVPLTFSLNQTTGARLEFSNTESFDPSVSIYLRDVKTGQTMNLRESNTYNFTYTVTDDRERFEVLFGGAISVEDPEEIHPQVWFSENCMYIQLPGESGSRATVEIYNTAGQVIFSQQIMISDLNMLKLNLSGPVVARVTTSDKAIITKTVLTK